MLEDGELSDDDLDEEIRPPPPPLETTNPTTGSNKSKNKISLLPTPKLALLGEQPLSSSSQIPSLLSPSFDSLIDKINSSLNQNNNSSNNKRKSKHVQNGDNKSSNKKKLKDKHHHHHHRHRHVYDDNDQDEDGQEEVQAQDQDDRLFDASATYFTPINSKNTNATAKAPLLATPVWSPAPSGSAPAKQAPVSLLDLFKNTNHPLNENHNSHQMQQHQQQQQQSHFVNPIIIEKENSKPKLVHDHEDEEEADSTEMVSVDSIKEKLDKKRKYADIHKITKQKEAEKQQLQKEKSAQLKEKVLCHFFVEGRCQKGDKCTFSHNLQLNPKKYEICKFYLNGFCAKGDKCFFMHAEFPCKFFHRVNYRTGQKKNECTNGEACRFSHEPITNVLLKEAFEKYLAETADGNGGPEQLAMPKLQIQIPTALNQRQSILGSPPPNLLNGGGNSKADPAQHQSSKVESMSSLPSLMNMSVKPAILATTVTPLLRNDNRTFSPPSSPPVEQSTFKYKDVDERLPLLPSKNLTSISPPHRHLHQHQHLHLQPKIIKRDLDIDERSSYTTNTTTTTTTTQPLPQISAPPSSHIHINTNIPPPTLTLSSQDTNNTNINNSSNYEAIKKELIIKVMKAIADDDESIFSQIPKQTLTELLVKILNTNSNSNENKLSINSIEALLTTLTPNNKATPLSTQLKTTDEAEIEKLQIEEEEEVEEEEIKTATKRKYNGGSDYGDYEDEIDEYDEDETAKKTPIAAASNANATIIDEEDDYDYDNDLVIEGNIGEIPYRLYEIDVDPSELWSKPPVGPYDATSSPQGFNPATLLSQISSNSDQNLSDQECDPRIKYYSEKSNWLNVANFQQLLIQQQQQQTPGSPVAATETQVTITSAPPEPVKTSRADPRLAARNLTNNLSPTRSVTPPAAATEAATNDLISIQNRQVTVSSLLSSLPDFHFPKDNKTISSSYSAIPNNTNSQMMMMNQESSTVTKLSIADYKRKLQKPNSTATTTTTSTLSATTHASQLMMNSLLTSTTTATITSTNNSQSSQNLNSTSSLPSIPSYSVNLQAPQSLHELFRNFQS